MTIECPSTYTDVNFGWVTPYTFDTLVQESLSVALPEFTKMPQSCLEWSFHTEQDENIDLLQVMPDVFTITET